MTRLALAAAVVLFLAAFSGAPPALRVCADPNNLPFSNDREEGFENKLARLVARDLGARLEYTWWASRRGFLRNTLNAGRCDVVMGLPTRIEAASTTRPYYRSTYVFVTRRDRALHIRSFDDPGLRELRIGVPLVGDDGANPPPAHALARRGIVANVVGYSVFGDYHQESPPSALIAAVAASEVDVAIAWGPLAGYFAAKQREALELRAVAPAVDEPSLAMTFDISIAVRRGDAERKAALERILQRHRPEIDGLLRSFHVPLVRAGGAGGG